MYNKFLMLKDKRYIVLVLLIISIAIFAINLLPNFEKQEFSQTIVENILDGITTTTNMSNDDNSDTVTNEIIDSPIVISESETNKLLDNNKTNKINKDILSYLLIGSDERTDTNDTSRVFVEGQRADVILLGIFNLDSGQNSLVSIPRDTLVRNLCTKEIQRINASFSKNDCGNGAENIVAAVNNLTGLSVSHIASFNFQGFENIINSIGGIEICVDVTQREGFAFELQQGCQNVSGEIALNWVVSRNTEVLVGEKKIDVNGNDVSEWKKMPNVSDLSRVQRQQYVVIKLLEKLNEFRSFSDLLKFIQALEDSFIVDEGLSINKATNILWDMRNLNFSEIKKLTVPTEPYVLEDGRQVLILKQNFYDFALENLVFEK
jgi:LCP family protein required for cell wall assembly